MEKTALALLCVVFVTAVVSPVASTISECQTVITQPNAETQTVVQSGTTCVF
jgi:hypothetical protein